MTHGGTLMRRWRRWWVRRSDYRGFGRIAARLAAWNTAPCHGRVFLASMHPKGFVAHTASLSHPRLKFGRHVYIGDRVNAFTDPGGGVIEFHDRVQLYGDTYLRTGHDGSIHIGESTHIQPFCYFVACLSPITIGRRVEIAPGCSFYSFNHGVAPGPFIMDQPLNTQGGIVIGDGAWLGQGVTVLDGVTIGDGAVIGAGSVVARSIPANVIAAGSPARVIKSRGDASK